MINQVLNMSGQELFQYGIAGIFIFILIIIIFLMARAFVVIRKEHREDRNHWLEKMYERDEIRIELDEKRVEVDRKYIEVLTEIKVMISRMNGRYS